MCSRLIAIARAVPPRPVRRIERRTPTRSSDLIGALLLGLIAGFIGRALAPNDVLEGMSGPKSWLASIALGLVGAVVGWLIFTAGLGIGHTDVFDLGGIVSALIGVVIVLLVAGAVVRRGRGGGESHVST